MTRPEPKTLPRATQAEHLDRIAQILLEEMEQEIADLARAQAREERKPG